MCGVSRSAGLQRAPQTVPAPLALALKAVPACLSFAEPSALPVGLVGGDRLDRAGKLDVAAIGSGRAPRPSLTHIQELVAVFLGRLDATLGGDVEQDAHEKEGRQP